MPTNFPGCAHQDRLGTPQTVHKRCQKPGTSLDYIRDYGIVSYDWSNNAATWVRPRPEAGTLPGCVDRVLYQVRAPISGSIF